MLFGCARDSAGIWRSLVETQSQPQLASRRYALCGLRIRATWQSTLPKVGEPGPGPARLSKVANKTHRPTFDTLAHICWTSIFMLNPFPDYSISRWASQRSDHRGYLCGDGQQLHLAQPSNLNVLL
jgi:hypothetical protein